MFNNLPNQQQLIPMGMQQQQIANMPVQTIQTYIPTPQNIAYENDSFISVSKQQTGKSFWNGFKSVFSKIGEFCTNNFGLILAGVGIFGGYKFCSNSMKTYEENKKEGKLDDKGNLKAKDTTFKENIMNFVGHGVHYVFGSSKIDETENDEEKEIDSSKETEVNEENSNVYDINQELSNGNISKLLKAQTSNANKIKILEVIAQNIDTIPRSTWHDRRPSTIIKTLEELVKCNDDNIASRAQNVATTLNEKNYFNKKQQTQLKKLSENSSEAQKGSSDKGDDET